MRNQVDINIGTVYGYKGSTAEAFARKSDYEFTALRNTPGDLNIDGICDIRDVRLLQDWLLCKPDIALFYLKSADMNADSCINAVDLSLLKKKILETPQCTLTYYGGENEPQQISVSEGDMLYELVGGTLTKNASYQDSYIGRMFTVDKINETGVSLTTYTRDYRTGSKTADFGAKLNLDCLLKGYDKYDYSFSLTFEALTPSV